MFDISSFRLDSAVLEIRYDNSFLLWDRAGSIWNSFTKKHPELKIEQAEPNKQRFTDGKSFEYQIETNRAHVSEKRPSSALDKFKNFSDHLCSAVSKEMEIEVFERVGFRIQYFLVCKDQENALSAFLNMNLLRPPNEKVFGIEGNVKEGGLNIRIEDEEIGTIVRIQVIKRKIHFNAPIEVPELESVEVEEWGVTFDVDYYTVRPIMVSQFKVRDWIEHTHRLVRRDSSAFIGGAKWLK